MIFDASSYLYVFARSFLSFNQWIVWSQTFQNLAIFITWFEFSSEKWVSDQLIPWQYVIAWIFCLERSSSRMSMGQHLYQFYQVKGQLGDMKLCSSGFSSSFINTLTNWTLKKRASFLAQARFFWEPSNSYFIVTKTYPFLNFGIDALKQYLSKPFATCDFFQNIFLLLIQTITSESVSNFK